jgi:putative flippase GtrA
MANMALILESCLKRTNSVIRFLLVGVLNTFVGLSIIFFLMNVLHVNYWLSTCFGNGAGAVVSFLLNRSFTFKSDVSMKKGGLLFAAVMIVCYVASYGASEWISGQVPVSASRHNFAVILGTCLYAAANYLGQKYIVFKKN